MNIQPDFIAACVYLAIVPPILVIRQIRFNKEAKERKKKFDEDMAEAQKAILQIESNNADLAISRLQLAREKTDLAILRMQSRLRQVD